MTEDEFKEKYNRLRSFIWEIAHIKKAIMTIPYNVSFRAMVSYITDSLHLVETDDDKIRWYSSIEWGKKPFINNKDVSLLVENISNIVLNDFEKNKKKIN